MIDVTRRAHLQSLCYPFHRHRRLRSQSRCLLGHQAQGMHLPARFDACFTDRAEEPLAIFVILEDGLAPISPIHEVLHPARIFHS